MSPSTGEGSRPAGSASFASSEPRTGPSPTRATHRGTCTSSDAGRHLSVFEGRGESATRTGLYSSRLPPLLAEPRIRRAERPLGRHDRLGARRIRVSALRVTIPFAAPSAAADAGRRPRSASKKGMSSRGVATRDPTVRLVHRGRAGARQGPEGRPARSSRRPVGPRGCSQSRRPTERSEPLKGPGGGRLCGRQPPPRSTRTEPLDGPGGSSSGEAS